MQQFMVIGRVGSDVKFSNAGKTAYARISIADNETYVDSKTKERKQHTTWIPVVGYGSKADFMNQYLKKGMRIAVSGVWINKEITKDGEKFTELVVRAEKIEFLDNKDKKENDTPEKQEDFNQTTTAPFDEYSEMSSPMDDPEFYREH